MCSSSRRDHLILGSGLRYIATAFSQCELTACEARTLAIVISVVDHLDVAESLMQRVTQLAPVLHNTVFRTQLYQYHMETSRALLNGGAPLKMLVRGATGKVPLPI